MEPKEVLDTYSLDDLQKLKLLAEIQKLKKEELHIKNATEATDDFQKTKLTAEVEKLKAETQQLKKPWFRQPQFLNLFVTLSIPILTLLATFYFGGGKAYLDAQKENIAAQNTKLDFEKGRLQLQVNKLVDDSIRLFSNYKNDSLSLIERIKPLQDELDASQQEIVDVNKQIKNKAAELQGLRKTLPIETLIGYLTNKGDLLNVLDDYKNIETLISKLKNLEAGSTIFTHLKKVVGDTSTSPLSKSVLLAAMHLSNNKPYWREKLDSAIDSFTKDFVITGNASLGLINSYSYLIHLNFWPPAEIHHNNKVVVSSILKHSKMFNTNFDILSSPNSSGYSRIWGLSNANDLLTLMNVSNEFANPDLKSKTKIDEFLDPEKDPETFFDFLKAYRLTLKSSFRSINFLGYRESIFKFYKKAYLGFVCQILNEKNDLDFQNIFTSSSSWDNTYNPDFILFSQSISSDFRKNREAWLNWMNNNAEVFSHLTEPNFETYRANPQLFVRENKE